MISDFDTLRPALSFNFYEYQKGKLDENFQNDNFFESRKPESIASPVYSFVWHESAFLYIEKYNNKGELKLLNSTGKEIVNKNELIIKESNN